MLIYIFIAIAHVEKKPTKPALMYLYFGIKNHTSEILLALLTTPIEKGQNSRNYLTTQPYYQI